MKNLNSAVIAWTRCIVAAVTFLFAATFNFSYSQCSLACNGSTQVSLDINCQATITPEMILNDQSTSCPAGVFEVEVYTEYADIPTSPTITSEYMGQVVIAEVIDMNSGNSCWGYLTLEDKLGPIIDSCPTAPIDVACSDLTEYAGPTFVDACEGPVPAILLSEDIIPLSCDATYIKEITRVYTAVDSDGYYAPNCTITYRLLRIDFDNIIYPSHYVQNDLSAPTCGNGNKGALSCDGEWKAGQGTLNPDTDTDNDGILDTDVYWDDNNNEYPDPEEVGVPEMVQVLQPENLSLYPFPDVYCNSVVTFSDYELPQIGCTKKIMRSWIVREWHCNGEVADTCLQIIEILDEEAPSVNCNASMTITTNTITGPVNNNTYGDVTCGSTTALALPSASDNCSTLLGYDVDYPGGFVKGYTGQTAIVLPMGTNAVKWTVYDECYNSTVCEQIIEVVDNTPPVAVCDQYTVVSLTTGGQAKVNATSFDDGSYDDCKSHCMLVRRMDSEGCECDVPTFCDLDYIGEYNGSYYYMSDYATTSTIAKARAAAYGGGLVVFDDYDEENWLVSEIRNNNNDAFYIGMKSFGGGWLWDDHSEVSYYNWGYYYPNHNGGDCVIVNDDEKWYDVQCTEAYRYVLEIKDVCGFSEKATFCCSDVGEDNMVVFRVVDVFGNFNDCMVNVNVQDKLPPTITCPANQTVNCDTPYDLDNLAFVFGEASVLDDCGATVSETTEDALNQCNVGELTRVFTATDNGGRTSSCKQILTFENPTPFSGGNLIRCPRDTTIFGCIAPDNLGPDVLGYPSYPGDYCDLIGTDWDDELYTFNNFNGQACFKLLRTWDIIDWCQQDPFTGQFPTWHCYQVVKISNNVKPEIEACDSISVCTYDSDCVDGYVELFAKGSDDCTENENLRWNYRVYTGASGVGPLSLTGTPYAEYSGVGDSINASGTYPIGSHIIQWTLFDKCGNATTCNQSFTVMNCKAATAYCISGLAVDLMPMDVDNDGTADFGMVELWASDFDAGSSHPCQLPVHLSFSPDTSERNRIFDCTTRGDVDVEIWASVVGPDGNLIQSYCETYINVQDNMNACVGQSDVKVDVDGVILTEDLAQVDNISVDLDGSELSTTTDINGIYAFPEMPSGGDYIINPFSNDDPLNGVSTLDIIEIQKHILGIEQLSSPYKMIAADINNDNQLTTIDLIELRKVILGVHTEFQSNDSWRFVDKGYIFTDPQNPLVESFTEDYEILGLNSDMNVDFIAVKVGDVNNTAQVSASNPVTQNRNSETMELYYEAIPITDGDIVSIPVYTKTEGVNGYQFTMNFDSDILEILQVNGITADLTERNYRIIDNNIVFSWNNTQVLNKDKAIFEIVARAKSSTTIHNALDISSDIINAEAYAGNKMLNTVITDNISTENVVLDDFRLYQNSPNPFTNLTRVSFNLPQDSYVNVNVHDVQGQLLRQYSGEYTKGMNQIEINAEDLGLSGVMYLTLQTEQNTASIKMVVLK